MFYYYYGFIFHYRISILYSGLVAPKGGPQFQRTKTERCLSASQFHLVLQVFYYLFICK